MYKERNALRLDPAFIQKWGITYFSYSKAFVQQKSLQKKVQEEQKVENEKCT